VDIDRRGFEVLDAAQCMALLRTCHTGRLALSYQALPVILPADYRIEGDQVIVHVADGSRWADQARGSVLAFQVDQLAALDGPVWSVLVVGIAQALAADPVPPSGVGWFGQVATAAFAIPTEVLSGRRALPSTAPGLVPSGH
jgi:hypothetical protein